MALEIVVQNINHAEQQRIGDDEKDSIYFLCAAQPTTSVLRGVYRYGDTMFNTWQLKIMLEQTEGVTGETEEQRDALEQLRRLADIAIRSNGYLMFIGD
ncbi:hypothetical protein ACWF99_19800 [Nocardia sp. NPDC055002]